MMHGQNHIKLITLIYSCNGCVYFLFKTFQQDSQYKKEDRS